jgi:hypothetical protein
LAGVGRLNIPIAADLTALAERFDVLIDFTRPAATLHHLHLCQVPARRWSSAPPVFPLSKKPRSPAPHERFLSFSPRI